MNTLRHRNGRFARNPVTPEQFRERVGYYLRFPNACSMAEAQQRAGLELRLRLICDDITGEVLDWYEKGEAA